MDMVIFQLLNIVIFRRYENVEISEAVVLIKIK